MKMKHFSFLFMNNEYEHKQNGCPRSVFLNSNMVYAFNNLTFCHTENTLEKCTFNLESHCAIFCPF